MSVRNSGVSPRARLTIAAVSMGAVALVAFVVLMFGSRLGGSITASPNSQVADRIIPASTDAQSPEQARKDALDKISGLPLYFEANRGQVDPSVRYLARRGRYSLFLTDDAAVFSLIGGEMHKGPLPKGSIVKNEPETKLTESAVRVRLIGANQHPQVEGLEPLPGRVNYLIGDKKNWHRDIPTFGRVRFHDVYPGIDVVYYGTAQALEYDLIAAPGADTSKIKFAIEGPAQTTQTASGDLVIATTSGVIRIAKPQNYQQNADGSRTQVEGNFQLAKDGTVANGIPTRQVGFTLASYDRSKTLFVDPAIVAVPTIPYSTFYGGGGSSTGPVNLAQFGPVVNNAPIPMVADSGFDVAIDSTAPPKAYITGSAYSNDLPTRGALSMTPFQSTQTGSPGSPPMQNPNVFVAKFDTSMNGNNSLIYATYVGAQGDTTTPDKGNGDGDIGFGIAVDGTGDAYFVGQTYSGNPASSGPDFPGVASCGAWGTTGKNNGELANTNVGFVSELDPDGHSLIYSCYIPGAENATAARVALVPGCASDCDAYVVGTTQSTTATDGFPEHNGFQTELATGENGLSNAFMLVVGGNGVGATPVYATYYGGTANGSAGDAGLGISVESPSIVAITGLTFSGAGGTGKIPLSAFPAQSTFLGGTNKTSMAFVAMIDPTMVGAGSLTYGSYLGGSGTKDTKLGINIAVGDLGTAIVLDSGKIWVVGATASTDFPVDGTNGISTAKPAFQTVNEPEANAASGGPPATTGFVTELDTTKVGLAGQVVYSSYFGGTGFCINVIGCDFGTGDAIGALAEHSGIVYLTGLTTSAKSGAPNLPGGSSPFPLSANNCQTANNTSGIPFTISGNTVNVPITAFVSKLDTTQSTAATQLSFSTLLGGSGPGEIAGGIQFDPVTNQIYVAGVTYSQDFPVTSNGFELNNNAAINKGATNAFLTVLNPAGNTCPTPFTKPTPTATATTATATPTATATASATATPTATGTGGTPTATATATKTATATATATVTATATATSSGVTTSSATATATKTATATTTATATGSRTATATATRTATATATATRTATATATATGTPTSTPTPGIGTLSLTPDPVVFGSKNKVGKTTKPKKVTIKNTSSKKSKIKVMITGETTSAPFKVKSRCIKTLAPGKTCKVEVTFTPTDTTPQARELIVNDDAAGAPQSVDLTGTGQ